MPFRSKAQAKKFAQMAAKEEISMATFKEWANATKNYNKLPERKKKKQVGHYKLKKHSYEIIK